MNYVPLISSGVAGPLGVIHLPRLWQKVSLESKGLLCEGYPGIGTGFDSMVLKALNLDPEKVRSYIKTKKPTYLEFEQWVKRQPDVKLDRANVEASNQAVRSFLHSDETRRGILKASGVSGDDRDLPRDAIGLNNLEDWAEFHARVLS
jgi:Domain of unknown function (DUF5069)